MRRVDRSKVAAPPVLTDAKGAGSKERQAVIAFYDDPANAGQQYKKYTAYGLPSVRAALEALFNDKCAYCEIDYGGAPWAVEHIRPKGAVHELDLTNMLRVKGSKPLAPGYYWLAAEWDNLVPSCTDCNSPRGHAFRSEGVDRTAGKANFFPLEVGSTRSRSPHDKLLRKEKPLLIDPCKDDPSLHLIFRDGGTIDWLTKRGQVTIGVMGLQRDRLVRKREQTRRLLLKKIDLVHQAAEELKRDPINAFARQVMKSELDSIRADFLADESPFLTMCKQLARENLKLST